MKLCNYVTAAQKFEKLGCFTQPKKYIFFKFAASVFMQASKGTLKTLPLACLLLDDWRPRGSGTFHGSSKISCEWTFLPRLMFDFFADKC
jgi:hypothetical protein